MVEVINNAANVLIAVACAVVIYDFYKRNRR